MGGAELSFQSLADWPTRRPSKTPHCCLFLLASKPSKSVGVIEIACKNVDANGDERFLAYRAETPNQQKYLPDSHKKIKLKKKDPVRSPVQATP